jgi:isoleucyl-tRNA synthetase
MDNAGLRENALKAITRVEWVPDWGQSRISGMIENRPDWCISRQRAWGVPLALFVHKETGELHPDTLALMEKVAQAVEREGIEAWYTLDEKTLLGKDAEHYRKSMDVRDVWFDSGVSHESVLKKRPELAFPADMMLEGSDQHRGWFQSSLLTSVAINTTESYKTVLTHGFVVDGQGRKMSKSIGNVIAPEEVISTLGADILRLWVASIDYRTEIAASKEILNRISETYRRIRNTARFFLANLHGFDPEKDIIQPEDMVMLDRWAVDRARSVQQDILDAYHEYQFHVIVQKLHHFCVVDMGGFYLDVIKDRQYTMQTNSMGRRSAQTALYHIAHAFVRWLAPLLSFTAEEIWQYLPGAKAESVQLVEWYDALAALPEEEIMNEAFWEKIRAVRDAVNKEIESQRNAGKLGSALEAEVSLYAGPQLKKQLDAMEDELRFALITSYAKVIPEHAGPVDTVVTDVPGLALKVEAIAHPKCERCWHRREDVNANSDYPGLCGRCVENVAGKGEERNYA